MVRGRRKRVMVEGGVVWNSIWSQGHEVAKALAQDYDVFYVEPVRTSKAHAHLQERNKYEVPTGITVVQHERILPDLGLGYLRYSEKDNLKIIQDIKPELLLTYQCLLGYKAYQWALKNNVKVVYMLVDEYGPLAKNPLVKFYYALLEPGMLKRSHGIIATAKVLEERGLQYNKNVAYIPNGINRKNMPAKAKATRNARPVVGFVGTLGAWVDTSWFVTLATKYRDIDVHVIGGGEGLVDLQEAKERGELSNLTLFGFLPHQEALKKTQAFDVALIPFKINRTTHAVSPIKLFEYWSMGKPVVGARTRELEQFSGKMVYATPDTLVAAIMPLLKNPKLRAEYGKRGESMIAQYDWSVLGRKIRDFVREL